MDNCIKISIIVPVYGTEDYIRKCADSIIMQTYSNFEVIFVDDGSQDACPAICDEYCEIDNRFKVVHKKNAGLGMARNTGIEMISGDYFTFVDSDDWIDSDHLRTMVMYSEHGEMDMVIASCTHSTEEKSISYSPLKVLGEIKGERIIEEIVLPIIAPEDNDNMELAIPMSVCFNIYKTSIMKENDLKFISERETVGEDIFFNLNFLSRCNKVNCIDWHGYYYRVNENSISRKYNPKRLERTENYYKLLKKAVFDIHIASKVGLRVERSTLSKFRAALRLAANSSDNIYVQYVECKRILKSDILRKILKDYPISRYRRSIKMVSLFMRHKLVILTMVMFKAEKILKPNKA